MWVYQYNHRHTLAIYLIVDLSYQFIINIMIDGVNTILLLIFLIKSYNVIQLQVMLDLVYLLLFGKCSY